MKKLILALAMILTTGLTSAFASRGDDINQAAMASFKSEFATATNISWQHEKAYTKVTFTLNDQVMIAYYNNDNNELIAVVRNILSQQLPLNLFTSLKKEYKGYWVTGLFEMATPGYTSYYVTLENSDETIVLNATGSSEWTMYNKTRKL
jgi:hypothetical protein